MDYRSADYPGRVQNESLTQVGLGLIEDAPLHSPRHYCRTPIEIGSKIGALQVVNRSTPAGSGEACWKHRIRVIGYSFVKYGKVDSSFRRRRTASKAPSDVPPPQPVGARLNNIRRCNWEGTAGSINLDRKRYATIGLGAKAKSTTMSAAAGGRKPPTPRPTGQSHPPG